MFYKFLTSSQRRHRQAKLKKKPVPKTPSKVSMESKKRKAFETLDRDDAKARDNNNNDNHVHTATIEQENNYGRTPLTSLKWDQSLDIPTQLKKLKTCKLGLSQNDFRALEYQLYCCRFFREKKNGTYKDAARIVQLDNEVYIKLIKHLSARQVLHLLIWRYHNLTMPAPSETMRIMFVSPIRDMEEEREKQVKTVTQLKINKKYTLRRMVWTEFQRSAATNTLDSFVYGFPRRYPMLSDLKCTEENHDVIHNFLLALLKANVSIKTIKDVCDEQLHGYYYKGTVVPLHVVFNTQSRFDTLMNAVEALK